MRFRALRQRKRPEKLRHRTETFLLTCRTPQRFVATDAQNRGEPFRKSTDHIIVHVPCPNAQRLASIHRPPWLWCLERRDIEQPLIDDGQRIAHRFTVPLPHTDRELLLRTYLIGDLDFGMQHRTAVDDLGPFDTVHADRQIVRSLRMGLQQGGMNVEVGSHLFRHWQFVSRLLFCRSPHPTARQHTRSVLHREQHTSSGCFRQVNHSFVTGLVTALIQREREHRGGRRIALARMSPPIRPVDKNHTARSMSALRITHKNQILSPRRIIDTERYFGFPLRCSQRARCDHLGRSTLHITAQITGRTFPPPTPTEFVYLVLQFAFGKRLLLGIQRHDRKSQITIRLELPIVQPNTDIRFIGRITHRTRSQALVTARLGDAREQVGLQHAGSRLVIHKTTVARNPSQRIELSGQYLIRRTGKGIKRIGENKVGITFERLRIVIESHFDLCIQSVRSRARQPMRFESDIRKIPAAQHIG